MLKHLTSPTKAGTFVVLSTKSGITAVQQKQPPQPVFSNIQATEKRKHQHFKMRKDLEFFGFSTHSCFLF